MIVPAAEFAAHRASGNAAPLETAMASSTDVELASEESNTADVDASDVSLAQAATSSRAAAAARRFVERMRGVEVFRRLQGTRPLSLLMQGY